MLKQILNFKNDTQKIMMMVILSILPAVIFKVYTFGFLGLLSLLTLVITALVTEKVLAKVLNIKDDLADYTSLITAILLFMSLNCNMSFFVYFIASVVSIGLGKMVYGGFAKNIFNPAMVGWCFIMLSFPQYMTKHIDPTTSLNLIESLKVFFAFNNVDSLTQATPLTQYKLEGGFNAVQSLAIINLLTLAGGLFLVAKKVITPIFPIAMFVGLIFSSFLFNYDMATSLQAFGLYGPFILAAFYIITDPVSSPSLPKAQAFYSFAIAFVAVLIAKFGVYPVGIAFAVVFINSFNFILDKLFNKGAK
jgi:electron transport complex protein RnfD